jgi:hypothetical protein
MSVGERVIRARFTLPKLDVVGSSPHPPLLRRFEHNNLRMLTGKPGRLFAFLAWALALLLACRVGTGAAIRRFLFRPQQLRPRPRPHGITGSTMWLACAPL